MLRLDGLLPREISAGDRDEILNEYNITFLRNGKGSHKIYEGTHSGRTWVVVLSYDQLGDDVPKGTLDNIKRQSGIPKRRFRS